MIYLKKNFFLIIFSLALFVSIALYQKGLDFYFFQDDFFEIGSAKASNIGEYINFFKFRSDIVDWRPISQLNYFYFLNKFFGLNPIPYRIITFTIFLTTAFLIAKVAKIITKSESIGLLTASFWLTSSIHFTNLTWISASYIVIGTFFYILTTLFFLKKMYLLSILSFLMAIGSFEFTVTWPVLMGTYYLVFQRKTIKETILKFFPYVAITVIYLTARFLFMRVPQIPEYKIALNLESTKALFWYILWVFNIPEEFKKQITNYLLVFNQKFALEYWRLIAATFTSFVVIVFLGFIIPVFSAFKNRKYINLKLIIFCIFWFLTTLAPVLIIPNHTFIMYLSLCTIGVYMLMSYLLISFSNKKIILVVLGVWIAASAYTLNFYNNNFWMINAQKFAKEFATNINQKFPYLPPSSVVYYPLNDQRAIQALQKEDAIKLILDDPAISIYYNKEELVDDLDKLVGRPIYPY